MAGIKPDEITSIIKQQLAGVSTAAELEEYGTVLQVGDGIARVYGLENVQAGELVTFESGTEAIVLNLEESNVGVVLMGPGDNIREGNHDATPDTCLTLREMERKLIEATFNRFGGNREQTAKALQIGLRTLSGKLREYGYPPRGGPGSNKTAQALRKVA